MTSDQFGTGLLGRRSERDTVDRLLEHARDGESGVLVLRGEPGVGKTALLEYVADASTASRIVRTSGVESEMELAFSGLHQLCTPMLDHLDGLPEPQGDALRTALGLTSGAAPDIFLVGLAVLGLLSAAAEDRSLVCLVDDAQWLDRASAQTLAFVARRLLAESVAMVFAIREPEHEPVFGGLPDLVVQGLRDDDARALLDAVLPGLLDEQVKDRIVAETGGNPLALLELTRGMRPADMAGGFAMPGIGPVRSRIEQSFERRVRSLPPDSQVLLCIAAADPIGDVTLLWRAAQLVGIDADAATPAESADLIELGARVRFRHPLVRSIAYRTASLRDRRDAHRALGEATDPQRDPDRRAWHRAQATVEPDEGLARELEQSAARAQARGGEAAAAAFLQRATELTPDPARRGDRALAAARAKLDAAAPGEAAELVSLAELCPLDDLQLARAVRLRARIAFMQRRGSDAPPLLLDAARRLEPLDDALARETHLDALGATIFAGRLTSGPAMAEVADAARLAPRPSASRPPRTTDLLLDGLATRFTAGYVPAVPKLHAVLRAVCDGDASDAEMRWLWLACRIASELWDDEAWDELAERHVRLAREAGALDVLPLALTYRAGVHVHEGEFADAAALIEEADAVTASVGGAPLMYSAILLRAWQGDEDDATRAIAEGVRDASGRGEGRGLTWTEYATAVLCNGLGQYPEACEAAQKACEHDELGLVHWPLVELVEAAARTDRAEIAEAALDRLTERTQASGTEWALGVEARSRALLMEGDQADDLYRLAVERLGRSRVRVHLARTHLVYGEWLRRKNRRVQAREQLRAAHELFVDMGAQAFAERARRELSATGETVRKRTVETRDELTAQETQIARLARDGYSNPEIGSQLFISPRTVEYHLHKVFTKLGISSRKGLRTALPG